ncbi:MAG: acryloyl-CoA reductase, partial [Pirellulaceae bacterium]|nr:acryloyl-CoA reductase [Pirellulaceae bacterium]
AGKVQRSITRRPLADLPAGDVLIRVRYSSLNYKDALAAEAHPGVVRKVPHVPGIDAAGIVEESTSPLCKNGDEVIVTSYDLGAAHWGAWADYIRVPAEWVVSRPTGLTLREAMILGTAGFTAAQCVQAILLNGVVPAAGEIVVTGATGGVGCIAVMLLKQLGYSVVAVTGKPELEPRLKAWGASRIMSRQEIIDPSPKPLLGSKWAGAVDTVGGNTLASILRATQEYGVVSACGLVGGTDLPLTVHPFILRGVILAGISSQNLPAIRRNEIWQKLAADWKPRHLEDATTEINLEQAEEYVQKILKGEIAGRTVIRL